MKTQNTGVVEKAPLAAKWARYETEVLGRGGNTAEIYYQRLAFFGGASLLFEIIDTAKGQGFACFRVEVGKIREELDAFASFVLHGTKQEGLEGDKPIAISWQLFQKRALPEGLSHKDISANCLAFYSGTLTCFNAIVGLGVFGNLPRAIKKMDAIKNEIAAFSLELDKFLATSPGPSATH